MANIFSFVTNKYGLIAIMILIFFLFGGLDFFIDNPISIIFAGLVLVMMYGWKK